MSRKKSERIIRSQCCGVEIKWKNTQGIEVTLRKSMLMYVLDSYFICSGCQKQPCEVESKSERIKRRGGCENPH